MKAMGGFEGMTLYEIAVKEFDLKQGELFVELAGAQGVFAIYEQESYEGSAFVLFERNGKLYEVNGSHCSCNGLEDTWSPEEVTLGALYHRMSQGQLGLDYQGNSTFRDELMQALKNHYDN